MPPLSSATNTNAEFPSPPQAVLLTQSSSDVAGTSEPAGDSCPPPLGWQQVVEAVHTEGRQWELKRNGYAIHGRTFGAGPPLYFLNGLAGTCELFSLTVWLLREDFRCVLFDYPDGSAHTSVKNLANDLFAVAGMHDDQRISLYATSFGTLVALEGMLQSPERIDRAILQGGFARRNLSVVERMLARAGCLLPGSCRKIPFRKRIQQWNHRGWFPPFDHSRWQFFAGNSGSVSISSASRRARMLIGYDLRSRLSEIRQPVLLIRSEGEGTVSEECHHELETGLADFQTEYLNNTGHLPYLTHPHRSAKLIRTFLLPDSE